MKSPALKKWPGRLVKGAAALIVVLAMMGYFYERRADAQAAQRRPRQGRLVDVGGYRLHLACQGRGGPTVVLAAGFLDSLEQWDRVQPEVAKSTRTCSYDRAGLGWSETGPKPRTAKHEAVELRTLLARAGEHGPFVLVGHSYSGLVVRMFASLYPAEVKGMVLDDSVAPEETVQFPDRFLIPSYIAVPVRVSAPFGVARLPGFCDQTGAVPDCPRFIRAALDYAASYPESHREVSETQDLGSIPLVVLAHDPVVGLAGPRDASFEAAWAQWQRGLTRLSSNSSFVQAMGVGHEIQTDQPQLVTEAILKVVAMSRIL